MQLYIYIDCFWIQVKLSISLDKFLVIGPAGHQTYRALVITCTAAATTATTAILPNSCH